MTEMTSGGQLGARLRQLRNDWGVTQKQISDALGLSGPLVSSWEKGAAIPPEGRLSGYARFFATRRSLALDPPALIPASDLTTDEERVRSTLIDDLVRLREEALQGPAPRAKQTGALGGRFWYFPDGQPITILCTPFSKAQLVGERAEEFEEKGVDQSYTSAQQYVLNPTHPNGIRNLRNGDIDALLELVGHIRAENPTADVQWKMSDAITSSDDLTGHIVVLGAADPKSPGKGQNSPADEFTRLLDLPVSVDEVTTGAIGDEEFDFQFVVTEDDNGDPLFGGTHSDSYRPRFVRDESADGRPLVPIRGAPQLQYDVALVARKPNPLNLSTRVTMCSGLFSRGTYGAVRAFTDASLRARNETHLIENHDMENFWMLFQVPIFSGDRTITPDLSRPFLRLRSS